MADAALRQLLAEFVVSIDPKGELAKGQAQVDALAAHAEALAAKLEGLGKAAAPAMARIKALGAAWGNVPGLAAAGQSKVAGLFGSFGAAQGDVPGAPGPAFGPTRDTLTAHLAQQRAAADAAAGSLRGRLSAAFRSASASADTFRISGSGVLDKLLSMRTAVVGLATGAVARLTLGLVNAVGDMGEAAAKLGVTTDEFQRLDVLAKQNATSVEALGTAFRTLAKAAADPTKDSTAAFKKLGVDTKTNGQLKSRQQLFFDTAGALAEVSNETERAALAQQLFGRSGLELLPLLSQGRAGLDQQRAALEKMALVSPAAIKAADEFGDRWQLVKQELLAKVAPLLEKVVIPALEKLTDWTVRGATALENFSKNTAFGRVALVALGVGLSPILAQLPLLVALGGGWIRTLGGMSLAAGRAVVSFARLALPFLALEDVIGLLNGDDSETGRIFTRIFGDDEGAAFKKAAEDVGHAFGEMWDFIAGNKTDFGHVDEILGQFKEAFAIFANGGSTQFHDGGINPQGVTASGLPSYADANSDQFAGVQDNRTQSVIVNVGTAAEVGPAVRGATTALGRNAASDLAAVGG